ncbi:MAG: peptidylprolyl isomerase [gamma proteobacterium symbiont of Taylorina sp.]|nr:peptidylprolyl isomerase [gamma proteobacterium symbiont of Taylorina sp.]
MKKIQLSVIFALCMLSNWSYANSVVCMQTTSGDFCVELYDETTPITVTNFIKYINDGAYNNIIFHRSLSGFILQSGGYTVNDQVELSAIETNPSIKNEYQLSNIRGTLAMAKLGGDPDSATSQWFINLSDNSSNLDNQNGGFTVFGRVIYNGMEVIDRIANLKTYNFGSVLTDTPTIDYVTGEQVVQDNFIFIKNAEQLIEDANTATFQSNYIITTIDAGQYGVYNGKLKLTQTSPSLEFALDLSLLTVSSDDAIRQSTLSLSSGELVIQSLKLSDALILKDVVLKLSDSVTFTFSLESIDGKAL